MSLFNQIKVRTPPSNKFDLSHERKFSCNMAELVPILCQEIVPGDSFRVQSEIMIRLAPMLAPIMHRVNVYTHYFFVPNRIVWDNWEEFITGGEDGLQNPIFPTLLIGQNAPELIEKGTLADYFGIPVPDETITQNIRFSALPFRAYQTIYNEYYRDENLIPKKVFGTGDGDQTDPDRTVLMEMQTRAWEKDYFTSALPFPQKGLEVELPSEINYRDSAIVTDQSGDGVPTSDEIIGFNVPEGFIASAPRTGGAGTGGALSIDNIENLGITIRDLRQAVRLQEWLEKNARGGSRYVESILVHFGVKSSDARLQRPEYLGGGKSPIVISEVLNTAGSQEDGDFELDPVGQLSGHGIGVGKSNRFKKRFEEHGHVIGIMSVLPRTTYQQGLHRSWVKFDKFDYYWPEFAHIGEQEILVEEVYHDWSGEPGDGKQTFGYASRYCEYKYMNSSVHGDFRDDLDYWHMGRKFEDVPTLSEEFISADPTHRIFAVTNEDIDKLYIQLYNRITAIRPMPYFSDPRL